MDYVLSVTVIVLAIMNFYLLNKIKKVEKAEQDSLTKDERRKVREVISMMLWNGEDNGN